MANFCTNCGTKLRKEDNFCYNCGIKIEKKDNFCTNLEQKPLLKSVNEIIEKKTERISKEKEEKKKLIDEIFESEEIKSKIRKDKINQINVIYIKDCLKNKLINNKENMSEEEIKDFINTELEKAKIEQRKDRIAKEKAITSKIEKIETVYGNYCDFNCRHCYEEFLDSSGGIVGDFDSEGYVEYYCQLGHSVSFGSFCEDYGSE